MFTKQFEIIRSEGKYFSQLKDFQLFILYQPNNSFKQLEFKVSDDNAWNVGLACGGEIKIYIEKINS